MPRASTTTARGGAHDWHYARTYVTAKRRAARELLSRSGNHQDRDEPRTTRLAVGVPDVQAPALSYTRTLDAALNAGVPYPFGG